MPLRISLPPTTSRRLALFISRDYPEYSSKNKSIPPPISICFKSSIWENSLNKPISLDHAIQSLVVTISCKKETAYHSNPDNNREKAHFSFGTILA
jgi:hypothetical protein